MNDAHLGSQAAHLPARALLSVRQDSERAAADAGGIALDGFALVAKGLRLIEGTGTHDDDVTRHLAPARLWHPDAAQRLTRAELLRELADVLEGDEAPTAETLERCIPDTFKDRLLRLALESRLRARLGTIDLPSRAQLEALHRSAFSKWGASRFLRALKGIKFGAVFMLRTQHRDK
jgi:hypothetical protein